MKGLALEIIFKWAIISVISLVVIGMILFFSANIKDFFKNFFSNDEKNVEPIESPSFSSSQLKTFIKACWDKNPGYAKKICYVLKGDVSSVEGSSLVNALEEGLVDVSNFDNSKDTTIIRKDGKRVVVESL